jgi:hypothetical protein
MKPSASLQYMLDANSKLNRQSLLRVCELVCTFNTRYLWFDTCLLWGQNVSNFAAANSHALRRVCGGRSSKRHSG